MSTLNFEPTAPKRRWGSANQKTLGVILGVAALTGSEAADVITGSAPTGAVIDVDASSSANFN